MGDDEMKKIRRQIHALKYAVIRVEPNGSGNFRRWVHAAYYSKYTAQYVAQEFNENDMYACVVELP